MERVGNPKVAADRVAARLETTRPTSGEFAPILLTLLPNSGRDEQYGERQSRLSARQVNPTSFSNLESVMGEIHRAV